MSRDRRRKSSRKSEGRRVRQQLSPFRLIAAALIVSVGGWLIATRSLPLALAKTDPETAHWLSPNHPAPQLAMANQLREQLFSRSGKNEAREASSNTSPTPSDNAPSKDVLDDNRETLKAEIARLAERVNVVEPLNAQAYRLLGEVANDPTEARVLMQKAVARSRRESIAVYWLLNDSTTRGDFSQALNYADILLRSRPQLASYVVGYLGHIAESGPAGFETLINHLSSSPPWRATVLRQLSRSVKDLRTPLRIMKSLAQRKSPVVAKIYRPYIQHLIGKKQIQLGYGAWLQLQSTEELKLVGLINNGSFDRDITNGPFGWQIGRSRNALTAFEPHSSRPEGRAFRAVFGDGRVKFNGLRQIVVLAPGSYEVSGEVAGRIEAKRGLRWYVRCVGKKPLGASKILVGNYPAWSTFSFAFVVPSGTTCHGQEVRLHHTGRSASEEFISGEIWFDNMQITKRRTISSESPKN